MTDLRTHRKDQGGLTNGTLGFVYGMLGTITLATLTQILVPSWPGLITAAHHNTYRLFLIGCLVAEVSFVYVMIRLGGSDPHSEHRGWYVRFRSTIVDNGIGSFYARGVRWALARIDRFFGDADKAGEGLWPRAFGLRNPAPLWTAQSYDRCLLIALVYPLLIVFLGWVVSGEVLAIEKALSMREIPQIERLICLFALLIIIYSVYKYNVSSAKFKKFYFFLAIFSFPVSISFGLSRGIFYILIASLFTIFLVRLGIGATSVGIAIVMSSLDGHPIPISVVAIFAVTFAYIISKYIYHANRLNIYGLSLFIITLLLFSTTLIIPLLDPIGMNERSLTLLFFIGLLTLINAPFDWLALGISRALLRRGLQQGGLAPIWLGLLDIAISLVIMTALAVAVLWSAEMFDYMTIRGGNPPVIDPEAMLAELRQHATLGNTHYWWLYAMLFSTQIPALINLLFGLFCLLRGVTGLNTWMLARLPEEGGIGVWQRMGVASVWSAQMGLAVATGLLGTYWFFAVLIPALDPAFGSRLIDWLDALRFLPIRPPGTLVG